MKKFIVQTSFVVAVLMTLVVASASARSAGDFTRFPLPNAAGTDWPYGITSGPDGALWFTQYSGPAIGRMTTSGQYTRFPLEPGSKPYNITSGPDGHLWFTTTSERKIGRITTSGSVTKFNSDYETSDIVVRADGNLWYSSSDGAFGWISPDGSTGSEWEMPGAVKPSRLAVAGDGKLWFQGSSGPYATHIGFLDALGPATTFTIPDVDISSITRGPDGQIWFASRKTQGPPEVRISRISNDGTVVDHVVSPTAYVISELRPGPDGNLWFTQNVSPIDHVGRMTPEGDVTNFPIAGADASQYAFTVGPDGNMWWPDLGGVATDLVQVGTGVHDPAVAARPFLTGAHLAGETEVCNTQSGDVWLGVLPTLSEPEWRRDGHPIQGATGSQYTPTSEDVGRQLSCAVRGSYAFPAATFLAHSDAELVSAAPPPAKKTLITCTARKRKGTRRTTCTKRQVSASTKFKKSKGVRLSKGALILKKTRINVVVERRGKRTRLLASSNPKRGPWMLKIGKKKTAVRIK